MTLNKQEKAKKILRLRLAQKIVNELCKKGAFKIPIHLAMGHEAIAIAVDHCALEGDPIIATHRNVQYNFPRMPSFRSLVNEYSLGSPSALGVNRGSMNLDNPEKGILYSSSILGNNLAVSAGIALAKKMNGGKSIPFVITGDGGLEEGTFYESLLFLKSHSCPAVVIVENNGWSLATSIPERRCHVELSVFARSMSVDYFLMKGNDPFKYIQELEAIREKSLETMTPVIVEVPLSTLGYRVEKSAENTLGRYINYHAGSSSTVDIQEPFLITESEEDPVFVLQKYFEPEIWQKLRTDIFNEAVAEGFV